MRNHARTITPAAAAVAAAVASILLLAAGAEARGSSARTLKLAVTGTTISTVDVPPLITSKRSPETPGDEVIAVSKLSGAAKGRRYLTCSVTQRAPSVDRALYACQIVYVLSGGTITGAGLVHLTGKATVAITGGTGRYASARGVLTSVPGTDTLALR